MVYFFRAGDRVKIGYALTLVSVRQRVTAISAASPVPIDVLGVIEGDLATESAWHADWDHLREHSEWFRAEPELLAAIASVASPVPDGSSGARLSFRCSPDLIDMVDGARGEVARERWLRRAVEQALAGTRSPDAARNAGGPSGFAAPAEQPVPGPVAGESVTPNERATVGGAAGVSSSGRVHLPTCRCPVCS